MKKTMVFGILCLLSSMFANCIYDSNLARPVCLNTNGSRIGWSEFTQLPLEVKYSMQNEVLSGIANGAYNINLLTQTQAKNILSERNVSVSTSPISTIPTPAVKICDSLESNWAQYCYMMNGEGDFIDCDHVDIQVKTDIVNRMWAAQGCVQG